MCFGVLRKTFVVACVAAGVHAPADRALDFHRHRSWSWRSPPRSSRPPRCSPPGGTCSGLGSRPSTASTPRRCSTWRSCRSGWSPGLARWSITRSQLQAALKRASRKRGIEAEADRIRDIFRAAWAHQPPTVEDALGKQTLALLAQLEAACTAVDQLAEAVEGAFPQHPGSAATGRRVLQHRRARPYPRQRPRHPSASPLLEQPAAAAAPSFTVTASQEADQGRRLQPPLGRSYTRTGPTPLSVPDDTMRP